MEEKLKELINLKIEFSMEWSAVRDILERVSKVTGDILYENGNLFMNGLTSVPCEVNSTTTANDILEKINDVILDVRDGIRRKHCENMDQYKAV